MHIQDLHIITIFLLLLLFDPVLFYLITIIINISYDIIYYDVIRQELKLLETDKRQKKEKKKKK